MTAKFRLALLGLMLGGALVLGPAATAAEKDRDSATKAGDPLVGDVIRMLGEGVDSMLVLDWLNRQIARPKALTPDELIGLSKAGASDELVQRLLALSIEEPAAPAPAPVPVVATAADAGLPKVGFSIKYKPYQDWDYEQQGGDDWDLFVYIDGQPLASVGPQYNLTGRKPLRFSRKLQPGGHEIRLSRERHLRRGSKKAPTWEHFTKISPDVVEFEVQPGAEWFLILEWVEPQWSMKDRKPLTWHLVRDGEQVAGEKWTGTPKKEWPYLCEDLELRAGKKPPKWMRKELENCVSWDSLWSKLDDPQSRDQILARLERSNFKARPETADLTAGSD